ncbi:MAG TPA: hypothetical protein VFK13_09575 [Gemmatimonadaceae bacterium]|nr:hypothetical protein [Gemmatimonadaceae bacterium]
MHTSIKKGLLVLVCAGAWIACRGEPTGTGAIAPDAASPAGIASRGSSDNADHSGHGPGSAYGEPGNDGHHGRQDWAHAYGQLVVCERRVAEADSALIGPAGGTLQVGSDQLVVPPGALPHPVMIRGVVPADTIASIHFEPEGLHFNRPAALVIGAEGCDVPDGAAPDVVYLDEDGNVLEEIDAVYFPSLKRVAAPIEHFSRYAIAL